MNTKRHSLKAVGIGFIIAGVIPVLMGVLFLVLIKSVIALAVPAGIGSIFIVLGIIFIIAGNASAKKIGRYMDEGKCLETTVYEVELNPFVKVNRHTANTIYTKYVDDATGSEYTFKSGYTAKRKEVGDKINVYVLNDNYNDYYMSL